MSENVKSFLFGFTNAFKPVDYSQINSIGRVSRRINNKISTNRGYTVGKINEITEKSSARRSLKETAE